MGDVVIPTLDLGPWAPLGRHAWCRWNECRGCDQPLQFFAHDEAVRWLQGLAADPGALVDIRQALANCGDNPALWRTNSQSAIDQLATLLVAGRVRVCGEPVKTTAPQARRPASASTAGPSTAIPIGAAIRSSPKPAAPSLPVEEAPPAELDVAAMVETLQAAARDGVPFCEECARAQQRAA